jgi:diguanylate cyclase (GGDEF)-like protein/PAS domain S-box-containing protein
MGTLEPQAVFSHPNGSTDPWLWASIHALYITALSVVNLVSWRMQEDERARAASSEEKLRWAFEDAPTGMAFVGLDGTVHRVNAALCRATGRTAIQLVGQSLAALIVEDERCGGGGAFPSLERREEELRYRRPDGTSGWALWHHSLVVDDTGAPLAWVSHCVDITERKQAEELLSWQASHDVLTGLPNRELFRRHVGEELERRRAGGDDGQVAVLFVDIDNFKDVNDSLGHGAGDRLLTALAERLGGALRPGDVLARFGGDEFTILLPGTRSEPDAQLVASRLVEALTAPLTLDDRQLYVSASVGVACADPSDPTDPEALLRDADAAMYRAKELGKGRLEVFEHSMRHGASERLELEGALRGALERNELRLVYQPLVRLDDDARLIGVEALLRWDHPGLGTVPPLRFIGLAEGNGTIVPIGAWVLQEACQQLAAWGDQSLIMAVNVSARQIEVGGFVDLVRSALDRSGVTADRLSLEITESAMLSDSGALAAVLSELKGLGVRLAVDDFGVGHASLRQLRAILPIDTLKIDRSFVDGIANHPEDAAIVEGVVRLAHSLGLEAVAEGVETAEQVALLRAWNCQTGQGYHFGRPVDATQVAQLLQAATGSPTTGRAALPRAVAKRLA